MKPIIRGFILFLFLYTSNASAWMTGNQLLNRINGSSKDQVEAIYFIAGVVDFAENRSVSFGEEGMTACIDLPDGVTLGQLKLSVEKNLNEHPENLHINAGILVWGALFDTFGPGEDCF